MKAEVYRSKLEELRELYPTIMSRRWQIGMRVFALLVGVLVIVILTASLVG